MNKKDPPSNSSDPLRDATLNALSQLIDPLLNLMFDSRVTVREFTQILRKIAVAKANNRIADESGQSNKSRVSIITGLPRSEVTRLLKKTSFRSFSKNVQHPTRKVLSGWFDDSAFLTKDGDPAILPAFGRRKSFERLVDKYGGGVPVRAMLDELTRIDAIEWLAGQRIRPRNRIPMMTGLTPSSISMMGERGRNLLETLLANAHAKKNPFFEATAAIENVDPAGISIGRREVLQQGSSFISSIDGLFDQLKRSTTSKSRSNSQTLKRMGVTVFYFEDNPVVRVLKSGEDAIVRRKNLRRIRVK
jgi:Family of unknown function (DUF6502)